MGVLVSHASVSRGCITQGIFHRYTGVVPQTGVSRGCTRKVDTRGLFHTGAYILYMGSTYLTGEHGKDTGAYKDVFIWGEGGHMGTIAGS